MSGSLRNKLLNYEASPPPGMWERIADELDTTAAPSDLLIASKLANTSILPPPGAWQEIESILDNERSAQGKVIPLAYKRLAVAVIAVAAVALTVLFLYNGGGETGQAALMAAANPDIKTKMLPVPSPAAAIAVRTPPSFSPSRAAAKEVGRYASVAETMSDEEPETFDAMGEVHFTDLKPVDASQPVTVPAMPLRDADGNIILDENLIRKPNDSYITVTSPNGSQTKISAKFLGILRYLNHDAATDDNNYNGLIWKDKIQAWRNKLLNEDSFIPAANNFFDIFEMKDIIEE